MLSIDVTPDHHALGGDVHHALVHLNHDGPFEHLDAFATHNPTPGDAGLTGAELHAAAVVQDQQAQLAALQAEYHFAAHVFEGPSLTSATTVQATASGPYGSLLGASSSTSGGPLDWNTFDQQLVHLIHHPSAEELERLLDLQQLGVPDAVIQHGDRQLGYINVDELRSLIPSNAEDTWRSDPARFPDGGFRRATQVHC